MDTETGTRTHAADLEAIRAVVATVERSQQRKDPDAFLALFRPDAVWTTAHGKVLIGLDAISAFTRTVLPASDLPGQVTYEVAHVLFIRPDVAAVKVRQRYLAPEGESEGAPLYVMSRGDDGRWLLTAGQNTEVVTG
ncbi:SgcJ/EcaC family oxidoreductase [Streptomyces sp. NPDC091040]|uniref:SgcJ/EcaC family oxidoreductase n=1 Tax=Streptomyces sp. NPDC091040 TaxID=3365972 RepID=UPI0038017686